MTSMSRQGEYRLLIRGMEDLALRPVSGTEGVSGSYVWASDSRKIAFPQGRQIKTVDVATGLVQTLCSAERGDVSDWSANGMILFHAAAPGGKTRVFQVPATGGSPQTVIPLDDSRKESSQTGAQFLPDGKRLVYFSQGETSRGTYAVSLDGKFRKLVRSSGSADFYLKHPRTGKSYLVSCGTNGCQVQQFDDVAVRLIGDPVTVPYVSSNLALAAAPAGLVYHPIPPPPRNKLAWYNREGKELEVVAEGDAFNSHELSPDDRQVAWELLGGPYNFGDIWVKDLVRGVKLRLTNDPGWEYTQRFWPDGSKIAYMWYSRQSDRFQIAIKPASGGGAEELVLESRTRLFLDDVSPDGAFLLYNQDGPPSTLWVLPMAGDRKPVLFRAGQSHSKEGRFSPDGRWIAYTSSDSGRAEIQVQDLVAESGAAKPTHDDLTVVSTNGGRFPRWSRDGKELFYLAPDNTLMAVPVKTAPQFSAGRPEKLFRLPGAGALYRIPYAVARDSRRFLIAVPEEGPTEPFRLVVVTNWLESLVK
jgi:eukaryotic-like serine/threonine-protein kinase